MCNRNNVAGERNNRRCDCECVFRCLIELLENALEENNNNHCRRNNDNVAGERNRRRCDCECVFGCLEELLEDALEEDNNHHNCCR